MQTAPTMRCSGPTAALNTHAGRFPTTIEALTLAPPRQFPQALKPFAHLLEGFSPLARGGSARRKSCSLTCSRRFPTAPEAIAHCAEGSPPLEDNIHKKTRSMSGFFVSAPRRSVSVGEVHTIGGGRTVLMHIEAQTLTIVEAEGPILLIGHVHAPDSHTDLAA